MTYYLIRYEEAAYPMIGGSYEVQNEIAETLEEAEEWAAKNYDKRYSEEYPPYAIKGEKIEFDFTRTVTVTAKSKD